MEESSLRSNILVFGSSYWPGIFVQECGTKQSRKVWYVTCYIYLVHTCSGIREKNHSITPPANLPTKSYVPAK
jgi:hypothetical protein